MVGHDACQKGLTCSIMSPTWGWLGFLVCVCVCVFQLVGAAYIGAATMAAPRAKLSPPMCQVTSELHC